jgi:hypothetical protein
MDYSDFRSLELGVFSCVRIRGVVMRSNYVELRARLSLMLTRPGHARHSARAEAMPQRGEATARFPAVRRW